MQRSHKNKPADNIVGLDIGPSTIACVSDDQAIIERFCDELKNRQKEIRRLQRKLERQRRANNPQNYNPDGKIKPGKKTWHESKRYLKTKTKLAELQRKLAAHRKTLHGNLADPSQAQDILRQGKHIKTEKLSYSSFQRNYGKSVKDRAPSMFVEILRRKAENAGGSVYQFPTKETKLSQYCHKCGKYTKKPLSQRWHTCCGLNIQRDIYSAFLAGSVVENKLDIADVPLNKGGRGLLNVGGVRKLFSSGRCPNLIKLQMEGNCLPASAFGLETERLAQLET